MALNLNATFTTAGINAATASPGVNFQITHVQVGNGYRDSSLAAAATALTNPVEYATVGTAVHVGSGQWNTQSIIPGSALSQYSITEVGYWSGVPGGGSSILMFYWSVSPAQIVAIKSPGVDVVLDDRLSLAGSIPSNVTILADNTSFLATLNAHMANTAIHSAITINTGSSIPADATNNVNPITSQGIINLITSGTSNALKTAILTALSYATTSANGVVQLAALPADASSATKVLTPQGLITAINDSGTNALKTALQSLGGAGGWTAVDATTTVKGIVLLNDGSTPATNAANATKALTAAGAIALMTDAGVPANTYKAAVISSIPKAVLADLTTTATVTDKFVTCDMFRKAFGDGSTANAQDRTLHVFRTPLSSDSTSAISISSTIGTGSSKSAAVGIRSFYGGSDSSSYAGVFYVDCGTLTSGGASALYSYVSGSSNADAFRAYTGQSPASDGSGRSAYFSNGGYGYRNCTVQIDKANSNTTYALLSNGNISCTSLTQTSDARLKQQIRRFIDEPELMAKAKELYRRISFSTFLKMSSTCATEVEELFEDSRQSGIIAQELQDLAAELGDFDWLVSRVDPRSDDSILVVDYQSLSMIILAASQAIVFDLAARLTALETNI